MAGMLRKDANDRYQSMADIIADFDRFLAKDSRGTSLLNKLTARMQQWSHWG